jgi:hypothetical protein
MAVRAMHIVLVGPMVPINDGTLLPEIAQVTEGLAEFIDGHAVACEPPFRGNY